LARSTRAYYFLLGHVVLPPAQRLHRSSALPIELSHALEVYRLPAIHKDPFDRLLILQSQLEDIPLLPTDSEINRYRVEVIWSRSFI
jgi:PIN domain nuclease of toxin-antitoxin system